MTQLVVEALWTSCRSLPPKQALDAMVLTDMLLLIDIWQVHEMPEGHK